MTRAAEIIDALLARRPGALLLERTTRLPYGWAFWIRATGNRPPPGGPASPEELAASAGAMTRRHEPVRALGRWAAFLSLWQQGWQPAPADERPLRWLSGMGSFMLHALFVVVLVWIAWLQSLLPPTSAAGGGGGEDRVRVGFVAGEGRAASGGGPAVDEATAGSSAAAGPADPGVDTSAVAVREEPAFSFLDIPVPTPPDAAPMPPLPEVAEAPEEPLPAETGQPVQVTIVDVPTHTHVLPPTTPRMPPVPTVREREVPLVMAPQVAVPVARPLDLAQPALREPMLREREVAEPVEVDVPEVRVPAPRAPQTPAVREVALRERRIDVAEAVQVPEVRAPERLQSEVVPPVLRDPQLREREIVAPERSTPAPVQSRTPPEATGSRRPDPGARSPEAMQRQVSGPAAPASVSLPAVTSAVDPAAAVAAQAAGEDWSRGPAAADDWGRGPPGRAPGGGLHDGQGRARLPDAASGPGPGERGAPGGDSDRWTESRIAQSGNWMQRPAEDFSGTRFDQYWVPNESLLADWVRRGVRNMSIPIPGTSRRINCVISLLQLGGGCGVSDDNMNEQPAVARPPPDVPFKPALQEDNGSVRPLP